MSLPLLSSLPFLNLPPLTSLHALLPAQRPMGPLDIFLGFLLTFLTPLTLITPSTPGWRLVRAGILAPVFCVSWAWLAYVPIKDSPQDTWGSAVLFTNFFLRTLELFVFYPPEENVYRVRPVTRSITLQPPPVSNGSSTSSKLSNSSKSSKASSPSPPTSSPPRSSPLINPRPTDTSIDNITEPVPPPWSFSKFSWSTSLWWSWRGIGWNFAPSLPTASRSPPFTPTSSRLSFLLSRGIYYALAFSILDITKSYMDLSPARGFFLARPGAETYDSLTTGQRAVYSVAVAVRIWFSIERTHVPVGMGMVALGGIMGWEGEVWSPCGWPPVFGGLLDLWRHPGLGYMWSRTWNQYNRRVLHTLGWVGIGENILGLPHSGSSPRSAPPPNAPHSSSAPTPSVSGRSSPAHPLPGVHPFSTPSSSSLSTTTTTTTNGGVGVGVGVDVNERARPYPRPPSKAILYASNLVKSAIVFFLSGLMHDVGSLVITLTAISNGHDKTWGDVFVLTPFFLVQPIALVVEAVVRSIWVAVRPKREKSARRSSGGESGSTTWVVVFERTVAFVWTWVWLGVTARYFVEGLCRLGVFAPWPYEKPWYSLFGWLIWGQWIH